MLACRLSLFHLSLLLCANFATAWFVVPVPTLTFTNHRVSVRMQRTADRSSTTNSMKLLAATTSNQDDSTAPHVEAILSSGLDPDDLSLLMEVISDECRELGVSCGLSPHSVLLSHSAIAPPGALGRVLVCHASRMPQDLLEDLQGGICEQIDQLLCVEEALKEAVLISFQTNDDDLPQKLGIDDNNNNYAEYLTAIVEEHVQEYEMRSPLLQIKGAKNEEASLVPSMHVEIDGGYVSYPLETDPFWDTSTLLVFDDLVSDDLRKRLLDVVFGKNSDQYDARNGPDPLRWVRGGLLDVPNPEDSEESDSDENHGIGWGLTDEGLEEICFELHGAVQEMESILSDLFPDFLVSRLPEVVLGCSVTPMTANAPTAGDIFDYHIDADPNIAPSSPWTDVYGRYPNRAVGKPRFMSCLVYLNDEWDGDKWGAPTRFVDVPTDEDLNVYDVKARPGRCIIMDQDIGHTVVAPTAAAGKRPRYSMVWKLILHPTSSGQDMKCLAGKRKARWPETEYFGSAAQNHSK